MSRLLRAVSRPLLAIVLAVALAMSGAVLGSQPASASAQEPIKVPDDVHKPRGTKIPVMWKVQPGKVTFYSAQADPDDAAGIYSVEIDGDLRSSQTVSMYSTGEYKLKCGKRYKFNASPAASEYPESYRIFIPCAGVSGEVTKVTTGLRTRVYGTASPSSKVKVVRVAIFCHGKMVKKFKAASGTATWRTAFRGKLRKGTYVARARIIPDSGTTRVVKRRFVVG